MPGSFDFDVLDPTKLIPEEVLPIRPVGKLVLDRMVDNFFAETEQVAFCTQNIVPGVDFTNDPLLQGRNFSYLDTQIKRLGGPNFTHIPVNAPKCPFHHFQQDGHMAMHNPKGRANYEPNSWGGAQGGPRETPRGFTSYPAEDSGQKRRLRPESFGDHYSQARQFYVSQTEVEQGHIADALIFELSKVKVPQIRERLVAHLPNIDEGLAQSVADGLGLDKVPAAHEPAQPVKRDLAVSDALSIQKNMPKTLKTRKIGLLVTDGADAKAIAALRKAAKAEGAMVEIVAPRVGGVKDSAGEVIEGDEKIDGAPSVLYDVVAVIASTEGAEKLAKMPPARQFLADAFAHCKFIGLSSGAQPLARAAGLPEDGAEGLMELDDGNATAFVEAARAMRVWSREV